MNIMQEDSKSGNYKYWYRCGLMLSFAFQQVGQSKTTLKLDA